VLIPVWWVGLSPKKGGENGGGGGAEVFL